MNFSKGLLGWVMFLAMIAVGSASAVCTNADLIGVWGFEVTSRGTGAGVTVGQIVFDGTGNLTGSFTNSDNGTIGQATLTGTYSLAKNCTGSLVANDTGGDTTHVNIVLNSGKKAMDLILTDSGGVEWGFALAQGTVTCGLSGKKETFAVSTFGVVPGVARIATVGQIVLDGNGNITSGTLTWSNEGVINTAPITGTYTENADCTGTATVTPSGFPTSHYSYVRVNAGKEVLVIQTDANTAVNGTMQK